MGQINSPGVPRKLAVVQSLSHVRPFFSSVDCITSGSPILHGLLEFAQVPGHWVSNTVLLLTGPKVYGLNVRFMYINYNKGFPQLSR